MTKQMYLLREFLDQKLINMIGANACVAKIAHIRKIRQ